MELIEFNKNLLSEFNRKKPLSKIEYINLFERNITQTKEELEFAARKTIQQMEFIYNRPLFKDNEKNLAMITEKKPKNLTDGSFCDKHSNKIWDITSQSESNPRYLANLMNKIGLYKKEWNNKEKEIRTTDTRIITKRKKEKSEKQKQREKLRSKRQRKEKRTKKKEKEMTKDELLEEEIRKTIGKREQISMELQTEKFKESETRRKIAEERKENLVKRYNLTEKELVNERILLKQSVREQIEERRKDEESLKELITETVNLMKEEKKEVPIDWETMEEEYLRSDKSELDESELEEKRKYVEIIKQHDGNTESENLMKRMRLYMIQEYGIMRNIHDGMELLKERAIDDIEVENENEIRETWKKTITNTEPLEEEYEFDELEYINEREREENEKRSYCRPRLDIRKMTIEELNEVTIGDLME